MSLDALPDDFRDLLVELADAGADFVLIGGWAMAIHGRPRATEDLDVLVRASPDNAAQVQRPQSDRSGSRRPSTRVPELGRSRWRTQRFLRRQESAN